MNKLNIALLFGGRSPEHDVSAFSAAAVMDALPADKYNILPVYITRDGRWFLCEGEKACPGGIHEDACVPAVLSPDTNHRGLIRLQANGFKASVVTVDAVFPALHGIFGEDGAVQGLCALAGIPCVGSGTLASAVCLDKVSAKRAAASVEGLNQTPYLVFTHKCLDNLTETEELVRSRLGYPCFVKPSNAGSSLGISRVSFREEFQAAIETAARRDNKIIAERAVNGRELEVGILGNDEFLVSGVGEIVPAADFYDYDAKYRSALSQTLVPADITPEEEAEVRRLAGEVYRITSCSGMARVDFFLESETGRIIFNEINTIPGFTPVSMYPKLFEAAGIQLPQLLDKLVDLAIEAQASNVIK